MGKDKDSPAGILDHQRCLYNI